MKRTITVFELKEMIDKGESFTLLDVREQEEFDFANIGGILIPLNQLPSKFQNLDKEKTTVVLCHHGIRSAQAQEFLFDRGFLKCLNLQGGIDQWSLNIDSCVSRY